MSEGSFSRDAGHIYNHLIIIAKRPLILILSNIQELVFLFYKLELEELGIMAMVIKAGLNVTQFFRSSYLNLQFTLRFLQLLEITKWIIELMCD